MRNSNLFALMVPLLLLGCVTTTLKDNRPVDSAGAPARSAITLNKLESADFRQVTTANVASIFGPSDLQGLGPIGSNHALHLYLTNSEPRSTKMSLAFDIKTKALAMLTWYTREETQSDFADLHKHYPRTQFIVDKSTRKLKSVVITLAGKAAPAAKTKKR